MNVLSAPFLYTLPSQIEAFACFSTFIEDACPLYVQPTLVGVHRGLKLLDRCLKIVDAELYDYLRSKNLSAELYAFPCKSPHIKLVGRCGLARLWLRQRVRADE
jgi:cell cycle arrest protein BUB2